MTDRTLHVLLVDDDPDFVADFKALQSAEIDCLSAATVEEAEAQLDRHGVDVVFLDINLGAGGNGFEFLHKLKTENPYLPVIMITADQQVPTVVKAMQLGASDYVGKSPHLGDLKIAIDKAIRENRLRQRCDLLASELEDMIGDLVGDSEVMRSVKAEMKRLAQVPSTILITGQSGTGKELVARGIHGLSAQRHHPFVAINCPALSHELIESELFGHEKGAFTGAFSKRVGKFEQAGPGTLFLDEITEIPVEVQAKLLRVLQEKEFERVGGNRLIPFRGRILASTNRDPDQAVENGKLRADLLYRLNVTHIHLPPLTERPDDIPLLVDYFIRLKATEMKKPVPAVTVEAMQFLKAYDWPGNVRELSNCMENTIVHSDRTVLDMDDFGRCIVNEQSLGNYEEAKRQFLAQFQRRYIPAMLKKYDGNITRTAEGMGITRQGLAKMIKSCGLPDPGSSVKNGS